MNTKQRFLNALDLKPIDRLPVTTHHVMGYFLDTYAGGMDTQHFFDEYGLDPILWTAPTKCDSNSGEYFKEGIIQTDNWRINIEEIPNQKYNTKKYSIYTPDKTLTTILQSNQYTTWVTEHLVKEKNDLDIIAKYAPTKTCDSIKVNEDAKKFGDRGLVRGTIDCFDIFGQPGCWQDLACLYGIEKLIMETFDDPKWVHEFLSVILKRKLKYVDSLEGANYDILELGGGDASSTVISPNLFDEFVAPYDKQIIKKAHDLGQRIVYHTCGGMMPILENIVSMNPNAIETLTPVGMGGDADLAEAKRRIGDKVCMIGGFDQGHYFINCTEEQTRKAVRKCFEEAGENGGFILSPSDHFFDAKPELVKAFADEARKCIY